MGMGSPGETSKQSRMLRLFLAVSVCSLPTLGHEYFPGQCPNFTPMSGFDWGKFSSGVWYVTQKFATKSSCLTYQFKTDELGFKSIEQVRQLPYSERVGLDHEDIYTGKLYAPQESSHAKMLTFSCHMCTGGLALYCRDRQRKILRLQRRRKNLLTVRLKMPAMTLTSSSKRHVSMEKKRF